MVAYTRDELMVLAAWMYYNDNLTHHKIAERLHTSRVKITRLLSEAREQGIIEIKITKPLPYNVEQARHLESLFGVHEAIVVTGASDPAANIGRATAELFHYQLPTHDVIGFGWSSTVRHMSEFVHPIDTPCSCKIVELVGSMLGRENPYSVSGRIADRLGLSLHPLSVPVIVQTEAARSAILQEPSIARHLALAQKSNIAFVGVGDVGQASTLVKTGFVTAKEIAWLRQQGAVGDILMRFYDIEGQPVRTPWDDQIIGLTWEDVMDLQHLVVVAYGKKKVAPLIGVLRSGAVSSVITDVPTAEAIIASSTK